MRDALNNIRTNAVNHNNESDILRYINEKTKESLSNRDESLGEVAPLSQIIEVAPPLTPKPQKKGVPAWIWIGGGLLGVGLVVLIASSGGSKKSKRN
jgi:hypothetical protein